MGCLPACVLPFCCCRPGRPGLRSTPSNHHISSTLPPRICHDTGTSDGHDTRCSSAMYMRRSQARSVRLHIRPTCAAAAASARLPLCTPYRSATVVGRREESEGKLLISACGWLCTSVYIQTRGEQQRDQPAISPPSRGQEENGVKSCGWQRVPKRRESPTRKMRKCIAAQARAVSTKPSQPVPFLSLWEAKNAARPASSARERQGARRAKKNEQS